MFIIIVVATDSQENIINNGHCLLIINEFAWLLQRYAGNSSGRFLFKKFKSELEIQ